MEEQKEQRVEGGHTDECNGSSSEKADELDINHQSTMFPLSMRRIFMCRSRIVETEMKQCRGKTDWWQFVQKTKKKRLNTQVRNIQ